jgi:hypothetical protein
MNNKNVFVIVNGDRVRYNKQAHHNTLKFELDDPEQFKQAKRLAFEIFEQIEGYMNTFLEEVVEEAEEATN